MCVRAVCVKAMRKVAVVLQGSRQAGSGVRGAVWCAWGYNRLLLSLRTTKASKAVVWVGAYAWCLGRGAGGAAVAGEEMNRRAEGRRKEGGGQWQARVAGQWAGVGQGGTEPE